MQALISQKPLNKTKRVNFDTAKGVVFFNYLQAERPHLLEFKYPGDKRQCVHGWLDRGGATQRLASAPAYY